MRILSTSISLIAAVCASSTLSAQNYTGPWYNSAESGWGLNIVQQGDVLFPTWFTYDTDGKPLWLIVSGAQKQADGSYTGDIFRTTGVPFAQIQGAQSSLSVNKLGTSRLSFSGNDSMTFSYTLNGQTQNKTLKRLRLGEFSPICATATGSRATATNYSDIWWNPSESGWGINLYQQGTIMFATWFTYGAGNRDQWYVMSRGDRQADGSFKGVLAEATSGVPLAQINGAPALNSSNLRTVGELTVRFTDGERGSMTYTVNGVTQTKNIQRQVFSSPQQVCRDGTAADFTSTVTPPGGGGSGSGFGCYNLLGTNQTRRIRQGVTGGAPFEYTQRGAGTQTFEGRPYLALDQFDDQNRRTSRQFYTLDANNFSNIGVESFDPATGALLSRARYSPHAFPVDPAVGTSTTQSFTLTSFDLPAGQTPTVVSYVQTFKRLPNETVTAAAGTFVNACKFDSLSDASTTASGVTFTVRLEAPVWTNSSVGGIRIDSKASSVLNGITIPTAEETTELVSFTSQ
jgi:hypothetical protein